MADKSEPSGGQRLAKVIARAGLCSRRTAEQWIAAGRVAVNSRPVRTPAFNVTDNDTVTVDGEPLRARQGTRVWLYHKPAGKMVTENDPEGRETIYDDFAARGLPRVLTIGRLDYNTEGLLLLTNDGGLKRVLELPATGWLRRYRVRAHGSIEQARLDTLKKGIEIDGVQYGAIDARIEREQGSNVWLNVALREGKNREIRNVLGALGLEVNRLIRVSYGPFQLGDLPAGEIETVKSRILQDQLGRKLADAAGVDFDAPMPEPVAPAQSGGGTARGMRGGRPARSDAGPKSRARPLDRDNDRGADRRGPRRPDRDDREQRRGRRDDRRDGQRRDDDSGRPQKGAGRPRRIFFEDGRQEVIEQGERDDRRNNRSDDRRHDRKGGPGGGKDRPRRDAGPGGRGAGDRKSGDRKPGNRKPYDRGPRGDKGPRNDRGRR